MERLPWSPPVWWRAGARRKGLKSWITVLPVMRSGELLENGSEYNAPVGPLRKARVHSLRVGNFDRHACRVRKSASTYRARRPSKRHNRWRVGWPEGENVGQVARTTRQPRLCDLQRAMFGLVRAVRRKSALGHRMRRRYGQRQLELRRHDRRVVQDVGYAQSAITSRDCRQPGGM